MTSRSLVKLQWFAIAFLILAYIFKPNVCPPLLEAPSRTVYVTMHDSTPKIDTITPVKTGLRKRLKEQIIVPSDPVTVVEVTTVPVTVVTLPDSCDEYVATVSDSSVDIQVKWCSNYDIGEVEISHKLKGIKTIHTIDSIPYDVGIKNALYLGAAVNIGNGFGPKVEWVNKKRAISYTFDAVQNQHLVGATFKLVGK